jgi:hypothetical protein
MKKHSDYSPDNGWPNKRDSHGFEVWLTCTRCRLVQRVQNKGTILLGTFLRVNLEISGKSSSMISISLLYWRNTP